MTNPSGGRFGIEIFAENETAIRAVLELRNVASKAFADVAKAIEDSVRDLTFTDMLSDATKDFKQFGTAINALESEIKSLTASGKGIDLDERFREAKAQLQDLQNLNRKGLGDPTGTLKEQQALQSALFLQQTQEAADLAEAKRRAFEETEEAAKRSVGEERALQEALFIAQTQGAHEAAAAKQKAYEESIEIAKQAVDEEQELQEALFLQQTQGAHEAAVAKQKAYEEALAVAKKSVAEERALQEALFLAQTEGAHQAAKAKEEAYLRHTKAAEEASLKERKAQEALGAELAASINRVNPQLARDRQREFDEMVAGASRVEAATGKLGKAFSGLASKGGILGGVAGKLGSIFGAAEGALAKFGFSISDISILLGTGFAGGIAGVILVAQKFIRVLADVAVEAAKLGGALTFLKQQIEDTFRGAAAGVNQFATDFGTALGLSEATALTFIGRLGQLFQAQGESASSSAEMAEGLLVAAKVFQETTIGAGNYESALRAVQNTVAGNIEGLREYNVLITEADLRQQALSRGIAITEGALDAQTRQYLAALEVIDQAQARLANQTEAQKSLAAELEKLGAVFTDIKTAIGQGLAAAFSAALKVITPLFEAIRAGFIQLRERIADSEAFKTAIGILVTFMTKNLVNAFKVAGTAISIFFDVLDGIVRLLNTILKPIKAVIDKLSGVVNGIKTALRAIGLLGDEEEEAARKAEELAQAEREVEESARAAGEAHRLTADDIQQVTDAQERLRRAIVDGQEAVINAERDLARAREDAARRSEDAQRRLSDAYRERNERIGDANRKLAEVERDNIRAIADAQERLSEAQADAAKSIRNAEEKLAETRIDSAKRVKDAEEALAKARQQRLDQLLDAQLSLFRAQLQGDAFAENQARLELSRAQRSDSVKDAVARLEEARHERRKAIAEAERDLEEARLDAIDKVQDAEENLARVVEEAQERQQEARRDLVRTIEETNRQIEEAQRNLAETELENSRRLFDAREALKDATDRARRAIEDAEEALNRLLIKYGLTLDELERILVKQQLWADLLERLVSGSAKLADYWAFIRGIGVPIPFEPFLPPIAQHGGRFSTPFISGDHGPELVIPGQGSATVLSNSQTLRTLEDLFRKMLHSGTGSGAWPSVVVNQVANDPEATAFAVASRFMAGVNQ